MLTNEEMEANALALRKRVLDMPVHKLITLVNNESMCNQEGFPHVRAVTKEFYDELSKKNVPADSTVSVEDALNGTLQLDDVQPAMPALQVSLPVERGFPKSVLNDAAEARTRMPYCPLKGIVSFAALPHMAGELVVERHGIQAPPPEFELQISALVQAELAKHFDLSAAVKWQRSTLPQTLSKSIAPERSTRQRTLRTACGSSSTSSRCLARSKKRALLTAGIV